jgi:hypothetical protein
MDTLDIEIKIRGKRAAIRKSAEKVGSQKFGKIGLGLPIPPKNGRGKKNPPARFGTGGLTIHR